MSTYQPVMLPAESVENTNCGQERPNCEQVPSTVLASLTVFTPSVNEKPDGETLASSRLSSRGDESAKEPETLSDVV